MRPRVLLVPPHSHLAPGLRQVRVLLPVVSDVGLLLEEGERAVLAAVAPLLLVVQLEVRQEVALPLEVLAALLEGIKEDIP